jgi:3-hydroxyacyl-CoA dehydrogenase
MSHGIAQTCTQTDYAVYLTDVDRNILEKASSDLLYNQK